MSILTFNFNIDQFLCDKFYDDFDDEVPESGLIFKRKACYNPTFFTSLKNNILDNQPELVVITTQGEVGYFHKDFLPEYMAYLKVSYDLLTHKQYKDINMSIYIRYDVRHYTVEDDLHQSDGYTHTLVQYINSSFGLFSFIGLSRSDTAPIINSEMLRLLIDDTVTSYETRKLNYFILMAHIPGIEGKSCKGEGIGVLDKIYDNFIQYGTLSGGYNIEETECELVHFDKSDHMGYIGHYKLVQNNPKVLCFSWNTDKIPLCDQKYPNDYELQYRKKMFLKDTKCYNPLFFDEIKEHIIDDNPEIVAINNEGDLESGTFFHYQFLRREMEKLRYNLLNNSKISNIGINNDTMRLSIYVRDDVNVSLTHINRGLFSYNEETTCKTKVYTKNGKVTVSQAKAMVKYVDSAIGIIAFMSMQIPHEYTPEQTSQCLNNMKNKLLNDKISYVFILGDFNFPQVNNNDPESLNKYHSVFLPALEGYQEGNYIAPNYAIKPIHNSERDRFMLSQDKYKSMSWHNRIYFTTMDITTHELKCLFYKTIIGFPMLLRGDHLGVMGVYEFEPVNIEKFDDNRNFEYEEEFEDEEEFKDDIEGILRNVYQDKI